MFPNWIPKDTKNCGFGVLIRYEFSQGTGIVLEQSDRSKRYGDEMTKDKLVCAEDVYCAVADIASEITSRSLFQHNSLGFPLALFPWSK
mmetsp:Transcript_12074/g.17591  ORF Transcript_12074/g.17591 Transcript_12074/m.17591 type:complete len:89 (-) Transcript_12074:157-423(-)